MGINFILMVNKQGQTRLSNYYNWLTIDERSTLEAEIIRKCLSRTEAQCSFMEFRGMKVVYRRYASLFFIVGVEAEEEVRFFWQPGVFYFVIGLLSRGLERGMVAWMAGYFLNPSFLLLSPVLSALTEWWWCYPHVLA